MKAKGLTTHLTLFLVLLLGLLAAGTAGAGVVAFYSPEGTLTMVDVPRADTPAAALNVLVSGPPAGLQSAIPSGTQIANLTIQGSTITVEFSTRILAGVTGEIALSDIYDQVKMTLYQFNLGDTIKLMTAGNLLSDYLLPTGQVTPKPKNERFATSMVQVATAGTALTGKSVTLSPGHGLFWNGSGWYTQRPVYCSPLSQEDYHTVDIVTYLKSYLESDGVTVKMVRETDKNAGNHGSGNPWWMMASYLYLQNHGYPCSVYASYTGDCTTGTNANESNDDVRARPLASNYDGTNIYIAVHTNGYVGDCTGSCPTGTTTYYDLTSSEHSAWGTISQNLANAVNPAIMSAITQNVDSTWTCHGACTQDSAGNYGEIRIPQRAAILTELAYHDTCDRDAVRLRDPFFTSAAMWGEYKGICTYFGATPTWGFYSDEYVSDDIPATMGAGEVRQVHITFRNRGVVWNEAHAIRLGANGDSDPFSASGRYTISGDVAPGQTYTFTVNFTAPTTPGSYVTDWRMVRDAVTWFGATLTKTVTVGDSEAPTVPQNLAATPVSPTAINLSWSASTDNVGVTGYKVYRGGSQIGTSATTSYSDTTCAANTAYSYTVAAYDAVGNTSAQSSTAPATTPASEYIIDNTAAAFTGAWSTGTSSTDKYGADYRFSSTVVTESATTIWRPTIGLSGNYDVYCWYPQGTNRSAMAPYTIYWNGGSQTIAVNEQTLGGRWNLLVSSKPFLAGTGGYVKLGNGTGEASKVVLADAIRFVWH